MSTPPYRLRTPPILVPANGTKNYVLDYTSLGIHFDKVPAPLATVEGSSQVNVVATTNASDVDKVTLTLRNRFGADQTVRVIVDVTDIYHQG